MEGHVIPDDTPRPIFGCIRASRLGSRDFETTIDGQVDYAACFICTDVVVALI